MMEERNRTAEIVGPCYDAAGLASWLGLTWEAQSRERSAHRLLGLLTEENQWLYPVWQFRKDGAPFSGLSEVLGVLSTGTADSWIWAFWLLGRVPGQLGGKNAVEWLARGGDLDEVMLLARRDAAGWAS